MKATLPRGSSAISGERSPQMGQVRLFVDVERLG
jgi:hypothetical protein